MEIQFDLSNSQQYDDFEDQINLDETQTNSQQQYESKYVDHYQFSSSYNLEQDTEKLGETKCAQKQSNIFSFQQLMNQFQQDQKVEDQDEDYDIFEQYEQKQQQQVYQQQYQQFQIKIEDQQQSFEYEEEEEEEESSQEQNKKNNNNKSYQLSFKPENNSEYKQLLQKVYQKKQKGVKRDSDEKINTSHVPLNMMTLVVKYLTEIYTENMKCMCKKMVPLRQLIKGRNGNTDDLCKRCSDLKKIYRIKKAGKINVNSFQKLFRISQRVQYLCNNFFLWQAQSGVLQKGSSKEQGRASMYLCLHNFLKGSKNADDFQKLLH